MYNSIAINKLNVFIFLITFNIFSQCTELGFDFGNNTQVISYNVSGDVAVTLNTDSTVTLDLASNFSTAPGPDVRAYLISSNGMSDTQIRSVVHNVSNGVDNLNNIPFGLINASGSQSFTADIPSGEDITSYDKIFFYCLNFSQFWDIGSFNSFTSSSCSVLSTEDNTLTNVAIYPNPATTIIQLSNIDFDNAEIRIFDFSGKKVFQQLKGNVEDNLDVSQLKTGIYVLSIIEKNKQFSQKLIIQ